MRKDAGAKVGCKLRSLFEVKFLEGFNLKGSHSNQNLAKSVIYTEVYEGTTYF